MRPQSAVFSVALLLVPLAIWAQRKNIFVPAEELSISGVLATPPASDSKQTRAEIEELHRIQQSRSAEDIDRAKRDDAADDIFVFANVVGDRFTREMLPQTALLSDHVRNNDAVVNPAKSFFHRPRPFNVDSSIKPVCRVSTKADDFSYPSAHTVTGYLQGFTLALIIPEKRDAILARADDYAHNRLVCGVHYPSDLVASKSVAYAMFALMMNKPEFQKELEGATAEVRKLGL